jgi:hypothetical protein
MRSLWRGIALFMTGGLLGMAAGLALGIFIFPYLFPPPPATEQLGEAERAAVVAKGNFIHANPSDPVHWGKGAVSVSERSVFLEADFAVGPGPAYHVYLVPKAKIRSTADMQDVAFVDLGRIRAFQGSQRYAIPEGTDPKTFQSVVIWCRQFGVLISPADLAAAP